MGEKDLTYAQKLLEIFYSASFIANLKVFVSDSSKLFVNDSVCCHKIPRTVKFMKIVDEALNLKNERN